MAFVYLPTAQRSSGRYSISVLEVLVVIGSQNYSIRETFLRLVHEENGINPRLIHADQQGNNRRVSKEANATKFEETT